VGAPHDRVRRLLLPAFKRSAIEAMRPGFTVLAEELIDAVEARAEKNGDRRVELISEVAEPYAARIICRILGIDEGHWRQVAHWADDLGRSFGIKVAEDLPLIEAALEGLTSYVEAAIDDRILHPRDDLVTTLVEAHARDARLTRDELVVALVFLAFAGMETTRNQIGLAVQTLLRHPDQWRLLGERPELGEPGVEQVMRVNPTVTWVTREAVEDVVLPGPPELRVPAGGVVQVLSHAAGTDPRAVTSPGLDLEAAARGERPPHTGFGAGIHHCLGHYVARVDMAVLLPTIARRWPDLAPDGPGEWLPVSGNTGALSFPLRF
jgi:cytochrome P450